MSAIGPLKEKVEQKCFQGLLGRVRRTCVELKLVSECRSVDSLDFSGPINLEGGNGASTGGSVLRKGR